MDGAGWSWVEVDGAGWRWVHHYSRTINDNNDIKPSGFIFYVEAISSEVF